jgi:hypothetical protein
MAAVLTNRDMAALNKRDGRRIVAGAALVLTLLLAASFDREEADSISSLNLIQATGIEDALSMNLDY